MSFLEELSSKLADVGNIASQKTQELTQNVKIQNLVNKERKQREELLKSLGNLYYEKYREVPGNEFEEIISQIKVCDETIQSYTTDSSLKTDQCPSCAKYIEKGIVFCPHCGHNLKQESPIVKEAVVTEEVIPQEKIEENAPTPMANQKFCTNCGSTLADDAVFCVECGNKAV